MLNENRKKILVVEDTKSFRELCCKHLQSAGYWVLFANRFQEYDWVRSDDSDKVPCARQLIETHFFHAAVIDKSLNEPESDETGFEVLKFIRSRREETHCMILTAYGTTENLKQAWIVYGANNWLDKRNFDRDNFLKTISELVEGATVSLNASMATGLIYPVLVHGLTLSEVVSQLAGSHPEEVRTVVEEALRPYFPYDPKAKSAQVETVLTGGKEHPFLTVRLWSRYLGAGLVLRVGSREVCQFWRNVLSASGKQENVDCSWYEYNEKDNVVGLVQYDPSITLEQLRTEGAEQE